jgi:hypothetical protein
MMVRVRRAFKIDQRLVFAGLIVLLLLKYLWPLLAYDVPLGYDAGIYRYLFLQHAKGFPPFLLGPLEPWARGHPLGLFFFSTLLLRVGVPVDWLIGWIWNLMPVLLALTLAWVMARCDGKTRGLIILLLAILSVAQFAGFLAMYWKTFVSLVFCTFTFHFLERRSRWAILLGMFTVAVHQQTGLLLGLTILTLFVNACFKKGRISFDPEAQYFFWTGAAVAVLGVAWYIPVFDQAVLIHLQALFSSFGSAVGNGITVDAGGGSFPEPQFFLLFEGPILLFGAAGFIESLRKEKGSPWQIALLWSLLFIVLRLFFYRRFFLQFEFFLLPFAALGITKLWNARAQWARAAVMILLLAQAALTLKSISPRTSTLAAEPPIDASLFHSIEGLRKRIPANALVLALEPDTAPWLLGWLPEQHVVSPGVFTSLWSKEEWELFLLGNYADRQQLLRNISGPVYIFASPLFYDYYGTYGKTFAADPCFVHLTTNLFQVRDACLRPRGR